MSSGRQELQKAGLMVNPNKCHLWLTETQYLGYSITRGLLKPIEQKVEAVQKYSCPVNQKHVHAFLGLAGYYRHFVPNFAPVATPFSDLTMKREPEPVDTENGTGFPGTEYSTHQLPHVTEP